MSGWAELYPDADDVVGLDIGGDEFPRLRASATTFGHGFPDPAEWLAQNAPTGRLIEADEPINTNQKAAA